MCEPATIGYGLAALVGGIAVGKALTPQIPDAASQQAPAAATPPAPTPIAAPVAKSPQPVQKAQAPAAQVLRQANTNPALKSTNATATMLTGASGVSLNPADIGRNTLLGS